MRDVWYLLVLSEYVLDVGTQNLNKKQNPWWTFTTQSAGEQQPDFAKDKLKAERLFIIQWLSHKRFQNLIDIKS